MIIEFIVIYILGKKNNYKLLFSYFFCIFLLDYQNQIQYKKITKSVLDNEYFGSFYIRLNTYNMVYLLLYWNSIRQICIRLSCLFFLVTYSEFSLKLQILII
jgi:hypothetical protein